MATMTGFKFRPAELRRILRGQTGHLDTELELIGLQVTKAVQRNLNAQNYPPVGIRPFTARRTGNLRDSITSVVTQQRGSLAGLVIADVEVAPYATRLRHELDYDLISVSEIKAIRLGRR